MVGVVCREIENRRAVSECLSANFTLQCTAQTDDRSALSPRSIASVLASTASKPPRPSRPRGSPALSSGLDRPPGRRFSRLNTQSSFWPQFGLQLPPKQLLTVHLFVTVSLLALPFGDVRVAREKPPATLPFPGKYRMGSTVGCVPFTTFMVSGSSLIWTLVLRLRRNTVGGAAKDYRERRMTVANLCSNVSYGDLVDSLSGAMTTAAIAPAVEGRWCAPGTHFLISHPV